MTDEIHEKAEGQRKQSVSRWYPGMPSPNPGGRSKQIARVVELARERTEQAIETLEKIMNDDKASSTARVAAASALLDRGWGKPLTISALFDYQDEPGDELSALDRAKRIAFVMAMARREREKALQAAQPAEDASR